MFPNKGKFFPDRRRRAGSEICVPAIIAIALKEEMQARHCSIKTVMDWTGASERTVKNWLAQTAAPRGPHLICLLRHSNTVFGAILKLAGRGEAIAAPLIVDARRHLLDTAERLDGLLKK